jgi:hypothetical protein
VAALRAGGLSARRARDVPALAAFGSALLIPVVAALEKEGWSLAALTRSPRLALAARAARQACDALAVHEGRSPPLPIRLGSRPAVLRTLLRVGPRLPPVDLQAYLRAHFTKVGAQTRDMLDRYATLGRAVGLPVDALEEVAPP